MDEATAAASYETHNYAILSSNSWFLGYTMEVFDAELYAVCECIKNAEIESAKTQIFEQFGFSRIPNRF
jgi:hypothetical protein